MGDIQDRLAHALGCDRCQSCRALVAERDEMRDQAAEYATILGLVRGLLAEALGIELVASVAGLAAAAQDEIRLLRKELAAEVEAHRGASAARASLRAQLDQAHALATEQTIALGQAEEALAVMRYRITAEGEEALAAAAHPDQHPWEL